MPFIKYYTKFSSFYDILWPFGVSVRLIIVKTPTTTSIQLNTTTIDVGFDMIMTVHHPTHPTQELYLSYIQQTMQCKLTQSLTILLDYLRQLSQTILDSYPRLSQTTILDYPRQLSSTILNSYPRLSQTTILDYHRQLSSTILDSYPRLSQTTILDYIKHLSQTILDNYLRLF